MKRGLASRAPHRQQGVFGIIYAIALPAMLGMVGLAVDLSMVYARGHELQAIADGAALAAARALDGTQAGVTAAIADARTTTRRSQYNFLNADTVDWENAALSFGESAEGPWIKADAVTPAQLPTLFFAQADTAGLDSSYGRVAMAFLKVVGVAGEQSLARRAVAGRKDSALGPLAICALNNAELAMRTNAPAVGVNEAVEYGFRRGVTYNLLNLNPTGTEPLNFVINPLDFAPALSNPAHFTDAAVRPFVCSGQLPAPPIANGSTLYVQAPFPEAMVTELNSRFGDYTGSVCDKFGSPPDSNIRDFRGDYPDFWMGGTPKPVRASAEPLVTGGKLLTVADGDTLAPGTTAASYGTLWSFARARRFDIATGTAGAEFTRAEWNRLYPVTAGTALSSTYSNAIAPYVRGVPPHVLMPTGLQGVRNRRVLNVPLLQCPFTGNAARVLGIGRFLMTTPATVAPALGIHAEFGGLTSFAALTASAVLIR